MILDCQHDTSTPPREGDDAEQDHGDGEDEAEEEDRPSSSSLKFLLFWHAHVNLWFEIATTINALGIQHATFINLLWQRF